MTLRFETEEEYQAKKASIERLKAQSKVLTHKFLDPKPKPKREKPVKAAPKAPETPRRPKRAKAVTTLPVPEKMVLKAVGQALKYHPKVAWHARMNTGMAVFDGRRVKFGTPGLSDYIGQLDDGRFLAVECKRAGGRLSSNQVFFLKRVRDNGGVAGPVQSVEDLMGLLSAIAAVQ